MGVTSILLSGMLDVEDTRVNQVAAFAFNIAGVSLVLFLALRARRLGVAQRNAVAAGVFGLILCGRYAALIDSVANWLFVVGCAGVFVVLGVNNLSFANGKSG
jgi:hypothetical protein